MDSTTIYEFVSYLLGEVLLCDRKRRQRTVSVQSLATRMDINILLESFTEKLKVVMLSIVVSKLDCKTRGLCIKKPGGEGGKLSKKSKQFLLTSTW